MSVAEHRAVAPRSVSLFVLTVSDTRTLATETSGRAIAALAEAAGHRIAGRDLVRDEPADVARVVAAAASRDDVQAVVTTGGTGIAARDTTVEAIDALFDKRLDGFGELFRHLSFETVGPAAMLSRATAGVVSGRIVFVLPGSEAAVRLAMERLILPELSHIVGLLGRPATR
ncbi:MAG TPA: molybdenum cofactor biosynthesis protein B [Vicinamibacterales bacterium]|nr:molybdenum cofactor biosynthesis protein B [Vicinamibacterales bacterium]